MHAWKQRKWSEFSEPKWVSEMGLSLLWESMTDLLKLSRQNNHFHCHKNSYIIVRNAKFVQFLASVSLSTVRFILSVSGDPLVPLCKW